MLLLLGWPPMYCTAILTDAWIISTFWTPTVCPFMVRFYFLAHFWKAHFIDFHLKTSKHYCVADIVGQKHGFVSACQLLIPTTLKLGGSWGAYLSTFFNGKSFIIKYTLFEIVFENMKVLRLVFKVFPDFSKKACPKKVGN